MGSLTWAWISWTVTLLTLVQGNVASENLKAQVGVNFSTYSKRLEPYTQAPYLNSQGPEGLRTMLREVENALNALEDSRSLSGRTRTYSREYVYQDTLDIAHRCLELIKYYKKKTYFHDGIKKCGRCDKTRRLQDLLTYITRELQDIVYNYPPQNDDTIAAVPVPVYRPVGEYGFHRREGNRRINPSIRDFSSGRGWDGGDIRYVYESDPSADYWERERDRVGGRLVSYSSYNKARIQLFEPNGEPWRRYEYRSDPYRYTYGWDRDGEDYDGW